MKFKVTKSSSLFFDDTVELLTLDELTRWCSQTNKPVIVFPHPESDGSMCLEIYDDYRE